MALAAILYGRHTGGLYRSDLIQLILQSRIPRPNTCQTNSTITANLRTWWRARALSLACHILRFHAPRRACIRSLKTDVCDQRFLPNYLELGGDDTVRNSPRMAVVGYGRL